MKKILVLNGPNLNLLGTREPEIYGSTSLSEIEKSTNERLKLDGRDINCEWVQTNNEYEMVELVQRSNKYDGLVINPGAFSHTSIAIYDALLAVKCPKVEVHLSNTHRRESFRSYRITAKACDAILEGLGKDVYYLGIIFLQSF